MVSIGQNSLCNAWVPIIISITAAAIYTHALVHFWSIIIIMTEHVAHTKHLMAFNFFWRNFHIESFNAKRFYFLQIASHETIVCWWSVNWLEFFVIYFYVFIFVCQRNEHQAPLKVLTWKITTLDKGQDDDNEEKKSN